MNRLVGMTTGTRHTLAPGSLVGRGVEGRVYRSGASCVKVYDRPLAADQAAVIAALVPLARKVPGFAWPAEIVLDPATGEPAGFAMKSVAGESLESLLDAKATASIPVLTKVRLALAVARAVAAAHAHRGPAIVLGDVLKAGNLVISGDEATFVDAASVSLAGYRLPSGEVRDSTSPLTTPGYVPKEVLDNPGAIPSEASDRFAIAIVLFELLLGRPPHEPRPCPEAVGLDPDDAVRQGLYFRWVRHPELEAPTYDDVDLPTEVDQLFRAAFLSTAVRPSAIEWCRELEVWLEAVTPKETGRGPRKRRMPRWLRRADPFTMAAIFVLLVAYAARWAWACYTAPPAPRVIPPAPSRPVGPPLFREIFK